VHAVPGVEFVKVLRIYETNLETGEQSPKPAGTHIVLEADELLASGRFPFPSPDWPAVPWPPF